MSEILVLVVFPNTTITDQTLSICYSTVVSSSTSIKVVVFAIVVTVLLNLIYRILPKTVVVFVTVFNR